MDAVSRPLLHPPVDFLAVADADNEDREYVLLDQVDDPVVAGSHSQIVRGLDGLDSGRVRIRGQSLHGVFDAFELFRLDALAELHQLFVRGAGEVNLVRQGLEG